MIHGKLTLTKLNSDTVNRTVTLCQQRQYLTINLLLVIAHWQQSELLSHSCTGTVSLDFIFSIFLKQ